MTGFFYTWGERFGGCGDRGLLRREPIVQLVPGLKATRLGREVCRSSDGFLAGFGVGIWRELPPGQWMEGRSVCCVEKDENLTGSRAQRQD